MQSRLEINPQSKPFVAITLLERALLFYLRAMKRQALRQKCKRSLQRQAARKILASAQNSILCIIRMLKRSRRGAEPRQLRSGKRLPTCHSCLLHPPPLVDL